MPDRTKASIPGAVIFDMDGTLLSTELLCRRAWQQAAREIGREMPDGLYASLIGRSNHEAIETLGGLWGKSFDQKAYSVRAGELYLSLIESEGIKLRDGITDLLTLLESRKIPTGVATSTRRNLALQKLVLAGIAHRFSAIVGGDEVRQGKPEPEIFLLAARRLGAAPADCLVFEDSTAGVLAASAAGMRCILIPDIAPACKTAIAAAWRTLDSATQAFSLFA